MRAIADTGLLKAALDADDRHHAWGAREFAAHAPFVTCEPVLVELTFLLGTGRPGLLLARRGDIVVDFSLAAEADRVLAILEAYADRSIDLADACLVRMSELHERARVWTVDRADFTVYRRSRARRIPCVFPPEAG